MHTWNNFSSVFPRYMGFLDVTNVSCGELKYNPNIKNVLIPLFCLSLAKKNSSYSFRDENDPHGKYVGNKCWTCIGIVHRH